jgi:Concanavalin A-like lectin/glucanases superfamily/Immunoglobulin I-set domain
MKSIRTLLIFCALAASTVLTQAQPVLSVDFNERATDPATYTFVGFQSFIINSNISATAIQTNASVRTFGNYTVTLNGFGNNPGYDDRLRGTPVNGGAFSQSLLLRDVIFSPGDGLDITIDGFTPNDEYKVTIWAFDSGSTAGGVRYSDWLLNNVTVTNAYGFTGGASPTTDTQYQFTFGTFANANGQIVIKGRRNALTQSGQIAVFINAFQISAPAPVPASIIQQPAAATGYAGDNVALGVAASGTPPLFYQWFKDGNQIDDATNGVLTLFNLQSGDEGDYAVLVTNAQGNDVSTQAHVTVLPVETVFTGLISHWPLDVLGDSTPDVTAKHNNLFQYGMDSSFLTQGVISNSVSFSNPTGTTNYLILQHTNSNSLPIYNFPSYTVAAWVKADGSQVDRRVYCESSTNNNNPIFSIGTPNPAGSGGVDIFIRNDGGGALLNHAKSGLVAFDNNWHHIAWVDNNGYGSVYVDGVKDTNNFNYVKGGLTLNVTSLGTVYRTNAQASFTGSIDDVAVWRRSLSASEIQFVMTNSLPAPTLVATAVAEGGVTLTYATPVSTGNPRVEQKSVIGGAWTPVENVTFSPYGLDTYRAQFPAPAGDQRFYRLVY